MYKRQKEDIIRPYDKAIGTDGSIACLLYTSILRHPAGIQTIVGTTNKDRIAQISKASEIRLTREEWYALYMAAGNKLP